MKLNKRQGVTVSVGALALVLVIVTGLFALLAAVAGWQLTVLRTVAAVVFVLYGFSSFPYPKEDRHKVGLAVGCLLFVASGVLAVAIASWWPLAAGPLLGFGAGLLLGWREIRALQWRASLPAGLRSAAEDGSVGSNFELIALDMALERHVLQSDHADRFPSQDSLLVTCGVLVTLMHIQNGDFTVEDVKDGLLFAKGGECVVGLTSVRVRDTEQWFLDRDPAELLLDYTLQIEAMSFCAIERFADPSGLSDEDIILAVLDQKHRIARVLRTPGPVLDRSPLMAGVRGLVGGFLDSESFAEMREEIGLR